MADRPKWSLIKTPNPSEFGISVTVPMNIIVNSPGNFPTEGDALSQNIWAADRPLRDPAHYGYYIYTDYQETTSSEREPAIVFFYGKNKTEEEKNTPFRTYTEVKNHRWPPILLALAIQQDYTFPNSTNMISNPLIGSDEVGIVVAPRNYPKYAYIPEVNEGTRFVIEEFFAATKFDIPQHPVPTTTSVNVDILDVSLNFPDCLHPRIVVPNTRTGTTQLVGGTASNAGGALDGQVFPATNFETWAVYVLTDQQEPTPTGWRRIRVRVFPPPMPEVIIR